jgi:serine/threonine protein kinase
MRQPLRQANKAQGDTSMRGDSPLQHSTPGTTVLTPPPINLGQTKLSEYTKLSVLGKGTYGEVHKCVHTPTGLIVAMKTYMFEVSKLTEVNHLTV